MPEREAVVVEGGQLHGVLEQAGPGRKSRSRQIGSPWVVLDHRPPDPFVVQPVVVRHHVELVGGGKLDVAVRVGEELCQLGLLRLDPHDGVGETAEQGARPIERLLGAGGDDLGERVELLHGAALGDALRAEGHVDGLAQPLHESLDQSGDPREHSAAQDEDLPVGQLVGDRLERGDHGLRIGIEVLVDRGADDHDQVLAPADGLRLGRRGQGAVGQGPGQHRGGTGLLVGHLARSDLVDRLQIGVVERDPPAGVGERQPQRQPHVPAAAEHRDLGSPARSHRT